MKMSDTANTKKKIKTMRIFLSIDKGFLKISFVVLSKVC